MPVRLRSSVKENDVAADKTPRRTRSTRTEQHGPLTQLNEAVEEKKKCSPKRPHDEDETTKRSKRPARQLYSEETQNKPTRPSRLSSARSAKQYDVDLQNIEPSDDDFVSVVAETPSKSLTRKLQQLKMSERPKKRCAKKNERCTVKTPKAPETPKKKGKKSKKSVPISSPPKRLRVDENLEEEFFENEEDDNATLAMVRRLLHTSEIPEKLPCREEEYGRICTFIEGTVKEKGRSQVLYICGVPGTGKTATVVQAVQRLKERLKFKTAFVNAMEMTDPKRIFLNIYNELFSPKQRVAVSDARRKLNHCLDFGIAGGSPLRAIFVIDELDSLCKNRQEIVYDIFNWTENSNCRVGVIAIANTFDLHEQFLARRIVSRMGTNRIHFQPYKREEVEAIVKYRLQHLDALNDDAVEYASRKVAAVSGDLRKALDMIRRAAEIAIDQRKDRIDMECVLQVVREASCDVHVQYVGDLSSHAKVLLHAALSVVKEQDSFLFCDLYDDYCRLCSAFDLTPLHSSFMYSNAMEMCCSHILVAAPGLNNWTRRFRLGMTTHEVQTALNIVEGRKK